MSKNARPHISLGYYGLTTEVFGARKYRLTGYSMIAGETHAHDYHPYNEEDIIRVRHNHNGGAEPHLHIGDQLVKAEDAS